MPKRSFLLAFSLALALAACGNDDEREPDPNEGEPIPAPGTCRALCCSDADCASGESCNAFDSNVGTIGACSGSGASQWSTTGALPAGCFTLGDPLCTIATSEECEDTDVCDFVPTTDPELKPVIACAGGQRDRAAGEACDATIGPWCGAKLHCVPD